MGRQPAAHRLAQRGGVSGPWRGAWNAPCRKRHVTMTPQKSRAAWKQKGSLAAAWHKNRAPTGAHAAPQYLCTASRGT